MRYIISALLILAFNVCMGQDVAAGDSVGQTEQCAKMPPSAAKFNNFHTVFYSIGKTFPFNTSVNYNINVSLQIRVYKNLYAGVRVEQIDKIWEQKLTADTINGLTVALSVTAFSNPLYRKGKSAIGIWGNVEAGRFFAHRSLGLPGGFNYYDDFPEKQFFMRLTGGMYYNYRGIFVTLGFFVDDLKTGRYDGHKITGIFRKPTTYGLELAVRFAMW